MIESRLLEEHVRRLAAAPRPAGSRTHMEARHFITERLRASGLAVRIEPFDRLGCHGANVVAQAPPTPNDRRPWFIVGAHYDSQSFTPGADDNATAVAVLLELARILGGDLRTLGASGCKCRLVAFDCEELGMLGSGTMAHSLRSADEELTGMISLEMLGYCDHRPGSQNLPAHLRGLYPDTGDFIGVVGNSRSKDLLGAFVAAMKRTPGLPVESLVLPGNGEMLPESRLSDHSPFWDEGYPALMVTDTSFFRNPHYHQPTDTADTIDFAFLSRVADAVLDAVREAIG